MKKLLTVTFGILSLNVSAQVIPIKVCPNGSTVNAYQSCGGGSNTTAPPVNISIYGAIAVANVNGKGGAGAGGRPSPEEAEKAALENCQKSAMKNGGSKAAADCKIVETFKSGCGSIASYVDDRGLVAWGTGTSKKNTQDALNKALSICDAKAAKAGVTTKEPCGFWLQLCAR